MVRYDLLARIDADLQTFNTGQDRVSLDTAVDHNAGPARATR